MLNMQWGPQYLHTYEFTDDYIPGQISMLPCVISCFVSYSTLGALNQVFPLAAQQQRLLYITTQLPGRQSSCHTLNAIEKDSIMCHS